MNDADVRARTLRPLIWLLLTVAIVFGAYWLFSVDVLGLHDPLTYHDYLSNIWMMIWDAIWVFSATYILSLVAVIPVLTMERIKQERVSRVLAGFRSLPSIAWLPITVAVIGSVWSNWALFLFVALGTLPLVLAHMIHGLASVEEDKLIVARLSGATKFREIFHIIFPASISDLFQAMRYGLALAFILVVVRDQFVSDGGYQAIIDMVSLQEYGLTDNIIGTIVLGASGIFLDQLSVIAERATNALVYRQNATSQHISI